VSGNGAPQLGKGQWLLSNGDLFNEVVVENKDEWLEVKLEFPVTEGDSMDSAKNLHQRLLFLHLCLSYYWNENGGLEEMRKQPVPHEVRRFAHMLHRVGLTI